MFSSESGPLTSSSVFCHVWNCYFRCMEITIDILHNEKQHDGLFSYCSGIGS